MAHSPKHGACAAAAAATHSPRWVPGPGQNDNLHMLCVRARATALPLSLPLCVLRLFCFSMPLLPASNPSGRGDAPVAAYSFFFLVHRFYGFLISRPLGAALSMSCRMVRAYKRVCQSFQFSVRGDDGRCARTRSVRVIVVVSSIIICPGVSLSSAMAHSRIVTLSRDATSHDWRPKTTTSASCCSSTFYFAAAAE